jgi:hypothetical protein
VRSRRRCTSSAMSYSCATRSRTVSTRTEAEHDACGDDPYPGHAAAERVPTAVHLNANNARYLATKAGRGAHAGPPMR